MMEYINWIVAHPWASLLIAVFSTWFLTDIIEAIGKAVRKP